MSIFDGLRSGVSAVPRDKLGVPPQNRIQACQGAKEWFEARLKQAFSDN
jgi:hypothetical protein